MKRIITLLLASLMTIALLTGCDKKVEDNELYRDWKSDNEAYTAKEYVFANDGKLKIVYYDDKYEEYYFRFVDEESFETSFDGKEYLAKYYYVIDGDTLYLSYEGKSDDLSTYLVYQIAKEPVEIPDLSADELKTIIMNAYNNGEPWIDLYGCLYIDWNNSFEENGNYYYLLNSDIKSKNQLQEYLSTMYTANVVEKTINSDVIVEKDGALYSSQGGVGGIGDRIVDVTATKNDKGYNVAITSYAFDMLLLEIDYESSSTKKVQLVYEDGKWLFESSLKISFDSFISDCVFKVE